MLIYTGSSRSAQTWKRCELSWQEMAARCGQFVRTGETAAEYAAMDKGARDRTKDVGGFVGGTLKDGRRRKECVTSRTCATLDIDYGVPGMWKDRILPSMKNPDGSEVSCLLYTTHSSTPEKPRYRLVAPFSRPLRPEEYEPVARRLAQAIGMDSFDDTTFQTERLFYWPSASRDAQVEAESRDGKPLDVDAVLRSYRNWKDSREWPRSSRERERLGMTETPEDGGELRPEIDDDIRREAGKAGDPRLKPGEIGAFCRAYTVQQAIEKFIPEAYRRTGSPDRWTYSGGSTTGGLVIFDGGLFAYSFHSTDPCSMKLCNAYDLVRIHRFGDLDAGRAGDDLSSLPSMKAMERLASEDPAVKVEIVKGKDRELKADFGGLTDSGEDGGKTGRKNGKKPGNDGKRAETEDSWKGGLELTREHGVKSTINNIKTILENDPAFKGKLRRNTFNGFSYVFGRLPWDREPGAWSDTDDAQLRAWLESHYGITGKDKVADATDCVFSDHSFHPIRDYLNGLTWDGRERLDTLVIDYLGAEDTPLNRAMTRKHFTAAVARVFEPGCKYDYCLVLTGPEGIGKSTLLNVMGGRWFSDSVTSIDGKDGMDQLRNCWIIELGELASLKRAEVESIKSFLSSRVDKYRPAYAKHVKEFRRQCVFCATTNEDLFLKGETGNRRFWVIKVDPGLRKFGDWHEAMVRDRDQLWAEAVARYRAGEKLYLDPTLEDQARQVQQMHNDDNDDPLVTGLPDYLDTLLPSRWGSMGKDERRQWITSEDPLRAKGVLRRDMVCPAEYLYEVFGETRTNTKNYQYDARKVASCMKKMPGWHYIGVSRHSELAYGRQKSFARTNVTSQTFNAKEYIDDADL